MRAVKFAHVKLLGFHEEFDFSFVASPLTLVVHVGTRSHECFSSPADCIASQLVHDSAMVLLKLRPAAIQNINPFRPCQRCARPLLSTRLRTQVIPTKLRFRSEALF